MNQHVEDEFDVIIVGAGVSGLTSALTILERDSSLNLLVLESTDKLGGHCSPEFGFYSSRNVYTNDLLRKLHIPGSWRNSNHNGAEFRLGDSYYSNSDVPLFGKMWEQLQLKMFLAKLEDLSSTISLTKPLAHVESESLDKISMEQMIVTHLDTEVLRSFMRIIVETQCGIPASEVSALFYIACCNSTEGITNQFNSGPDGAYSCMFKGGETHICNTISNNYDFQIRYKQHVVEIRRQTNYMIVKTNKEIYSCSHVVITLAPNEILKINFDPPLSPVRDNILRNMIPSRLTGMQLQFRRIEDMPKLHDVFNTCADASDCILRCMPVGGELHMYVVSKKGSDVDILMHMHQFFDLARTTCISQIKHSVAAPKIGMMSGLHEIRKPVNGIFWAGSETSTTWYGHLEGSIQSGVRAGIELLYDYKPQILAMQDITRLTEKRPLVALFKNQPLYQILQHKREYLGYATVCILLAAYIFRRYVTWRKN